ncbi:MAG: polysaccharide deacetylase [Lachnospiraceae bacterium]|nr:polysaccharide deacetylase [Lachnospiraceae bacterium]
MMDERDALKQKRDKQTRIRKMKMFIVGFIMIGLLISLLCNVFLIFKTISFESRLKKVEESKASGIVSAKKSDIGTLTLSDSGTGEANLANPNDTLKVYLTFDDGPSKNTNKILDILDDYGVKATFFVCGKQGKNAKASYKRIVNEGHTIGMHSYSHKYSDVYASLSSFKKDYDKIHDLIFDVTGVDCKLYRFPGGSSNKVSGEDMSYFINFLNENKITYFDWNISSGDATSKAYTSDELIENVMNDVVKYKTSVVLMHDADDKGATVDALPRLIESLQSRGAIILPISDDTNLIQHVTLQN